jgi:hypothetical protein
MKPTACQNLRSTNEAAHLTTILDENTSHTVLLQGFLIRVRLWGETDRLAVRIYAEAVFQVVDK